MGTIFNIFKLFFQEVVPAFGDRDVTVVLSVGRNFDRTKLGRVPLNIFIRRFVDPWAVLEKADLFNAHGGMNSINQEVVKDLDDIFNCL